MEIKVGMLEGVFTGGLLTSLALIPINWLKNDPTYAMAIFGGTALFWIVFLSLGGIIKYGFKKKPEKGQKNV